ncbi:uncharacterized protein TNCV_519351 [Trichonephila clavipes]|nr:uncharacterized protein TNCV_519351 [Trichonephila clavipes]
MEHVWDALGRRIAARLHHPENTQQLKQMLIEEWALLPQEMLHQLVLSMRRREQCDTNVLELSPWCISPDNSDIVSSEMTLIHQILHDQFSYLKSGFYSGGLLVLGTCKTPKETYAMLVRVYEDQSLCMKQWRNGEHLGPLAKSGFVPPRLILQRVGTCVSQALGPLEPWATRDAGVLEVFKQMFQQIRIFIDKKLRETQRYIGWTKKKKEEKFDSPRHDDEEVQPVPCLCKVGVPSECPHGCDLDEHLEGEESEDEVIEVLQNAASARVAHLVRTRTVHAQRHTVQQNHRHAQTLEPREQAS